MGDIMKVFNKLRREFAAHYPRLFANLVVVGLAYILFLGAANMWQALNAAVPVEIALGIATCFGVVVIVLALMLMKAKRELSAAKAMPKLRLRFGALWDHELQPHCPLHKTALRNYDRYGAGDWGFLCTECKDVIRLKDEDGKSLKFRTAQERLRQE
jgi:hypothetical protein